ncbi:MAG TPA: DnaJ domain-containing protein [Desulfobacteria bacterium]|nr:DnaJ domain-containing protein [Desulfobacteria bacterium]
MEQFFKILKVTPTASLEEVKRAYKERVKFWHPDRFPVESERLQKLAHRQMSEINQAYRELEQHYARLMLNAGDSPKPPLAAVKVKPPTLQFQNGDCYIGQLAGSVPHGHGTYLFAGGNKYNGEFANGKPHGRGILVFTNGDRYEGDFVNDTMEGEGIYTSGNGDRFVGGFKSGQPHGRGVHITAAGKQYPGLWEEGCLIEQE